MHMLRQESLRRSLWVLHPYNTRACWVSSQPGQLGVSAHRRVIGYTANPVTERSPGCILLKATSELKRYLQRECYRLQDASSDTGDVVGRRLRLAHSIPPLLTLYLNPCPVFRRCIYHVPYS